MPIKDLGISLKFCTLIKLRFLEPQNLNLPL